MFQVPEGGSVVLSGAASTDPDGDDLLYEWDLNGDNIIDFTSRDIVFSAVGLDGPGPFMVELTLRDGDPAVRADAMSGTTNAAVSIKNVPPTLITAHLDDPIEGQPFSFDAIVVDPGSDTISEWIIGWGDGSTTTTSTLQVAHTYSHQDRTTLTISVTDEDGTYPLYEEEFNIRNLPPVPVNFLVAQDGAIDVIVDEPLVDDLGNALFDPVTAYEFVAFADAEEKLRQTFTLSEMEQLNTSPPEYQATLTGLTNGTVYTVTVASINVDGTGAATTSAQTVTPVDTAMVSINTGLNGFTISSLRTTRFGAFPLTSSGTPAPDVNLTWESSGGSIDEFGLFVAPVGPTQVTISLTGHQPSTGATSTADLIVTVLEPPAPPPTPEPVNPSGPIPDPPPSTIDGAATGIITPEQGAVVSSSDGATTVRIRPSTVSEFLVIQIAEIQPEQVPEVSTGVRLITLGDPVLELSFTTPDGAPVPDFIADRAVEITFRYTDAQAEAAGGALNLVVMKYDEEIGAWSKLNTQVDLMAKTLTAFVKRFSLFTVGTEIDESPNITPTPAPTATPRADVILPATRDRTAERDASTRILIVGLLLAVLGLTAGSIWHRNIVRRL